MTNYAISDVSKVLNERDWSDWDELIGWLEKEPASASDGLSERDKTELLRDLRAARDEGQELLRKPGDLYRAIRPIN